MAGNSLSLVWDLIARDGASPTFDRVSKSADKAAASTEAASAKISGGMSTAAKAASAAGVVFAAASIKMAADFQSSTVRLVTSANESQRNLKMVQQGMLDMAGQLGYSTEELSKAMYKVESGGQHGAAGLATLKAAAQGAKTENADLTTVADALTSAMTDYHLKASDAATVTSKLVAATASGKMTFEELAGSLAAILPVASANHVALNDILGDLASMTMHGMSAEQASQNLADAIRHLAAPTQQQQKEFAALGLTAQQITADLGTKGLSGTINVIGDAIRAQMGASTSQVVLDLSTALSRLPAPVKALGQSILDGTISLGDYRKAMKALPAEQAIAAQSFMGLVSSTHQIGNETKNGAEIYQSYSGALRQALGDATGMNVALMIGGENAGNTAKAIDNVSKATADAKGNVKGWSEIQGTFNQQASETLYSLEAMTIQFGMKLLPAATAAMGYINRDVIPGIEHLASGAGSAARAFGGLPEPIKDVAYAFAVLKAADMLGLLDRLGSGTGKVKASFQGLREEMALQQALYASQQRSVATLNAEYGTMAERLAALTAAEDVAGASASRMSGVVGTGAVRAMSGLKAAGSGLLSMLGGPWGVAFLGATFGVTALMDAVKRHDEQIKAATVDVQKWNEAIALGGSGQSGIQAQSHLEDLRKKLAEVTAQINAYNDAAKAGEARGGIGSLISRQAELRGELDKGSAAWKAQLAVMTPVEEATARVQIAEHDLQMVRKTNPDNSQAVINAEIRLQQAREGLTGETDRANAAEKTQIQRLQDSAGATLGLVDANRQAMEASLSLTQQVSDYNKQIADGTLKGDALKSATLGIVDSAEQAAKAAGDAAAKQAEQNGATDTGAASQAVFMKTLQDFDSTLTGPAKKAMDDYIAQLGGQQSQAQLTAGAINGLGIQVTDLPNSHMIDIQAPTDKQMKDLHDLGYATVNLPNGKIVVTADTNPAIGEIQDLLNYARQQSIQYRSDLPPLAGQENVSGGGRMGHAATGGWISGPGTGTSDSVPMWLSDGEFVVNAASAAQHADVLTAINSGMGRMADGGWVNVPPGGWFAGQSNIPVSVDETQAKAVIAQVYKAAAATAFAPGAPTNVLGNAAIVQAAAAARGWTGAEWNALYALVMRESGFRNTAANPTSTAYGMFQFLDSTWAGYGLGKTSDPRAQTRAGLDYIAGRYGSPAGAWGHETRYGWYDNGGWLQPGLTMAYNGTGKPERVLTAEQAGQAITLQLDGPAVTDLLEGRAVRVVTEYADASYHRGQYNG